MLEHACANGVTIYGERPVADQFMALVHNHQDVFEDRGMTVDIPGDE